MTAATSTVSRIFGWSASPTQQRSVDGVESQETDNLMAQI